METTNKLPMRGPAYTWTKSNSATTVNDDWDSDEGREVRWEARCHKCGERAVKSDKFGRMACEVHAGPHVKPVVRVAPKIGRNEPCLCGSGLKFKRCCVKG